MFIVDANIWISYFIVTDAFHSRAVNWINQQIANRSYFVSTELLLAEIAGAIARQYNQPDAVRAVDFMRRLPESIVFSLDTGLGKTAVDLAINLRLRGPDATYVALAYELGIPLVTWDKEIDTKAGKTITVQMP